MQIYKTLEESFIYAYAREAREFYSLPVVHKSLIRAFKIGIDSSNLNFSVNRLGS